MLSSLSIKNIALIDDIELTLFGGLNILSGETGAGKSIIIDSLNFVLGERADKTLIRHGTASANVEAVFDDYATTSVSAYLQEIGISAEDSLILRRTMSIEGKNECRINGRAVTLGTLKGLTALLCDIHGQHEHQRLLDTDTHLVLLDAFGEDKISAPKSAHTACFAVAEELRKKLASIGDSASRERKIDILSFQIEEITTADVQEDELDNLLAERKRIQNIGAIGDSLTQADDSLLGGSYSVMSSVNTALKALQKVSGFDAEISSLAERLESCKIELKDIADSVSDASSALGFDENRMEEVENRISKLRSLFKKYGGDFEAMKRFANEAQEELDFLLNADEEYAVLNQKYIDAKEKSVASASALSAARRDVATVLEKKIEKELADLGMSGTSFKVAFDEQASTITANGADVVEFLISPNLGEPLKPLAKIISGGEMSRFMLALKNITSDLENISTMVFDEIDTGISGHIAEVVSEKLYNISVERQVIAVTHLPQLASMADVHFLIKKVVENGKTLTRLIPLDASERVAELARLVGGDSFSEFAKSHASAMLEHAAKYKKGIR